MGVRPERAYSGAMTHGPELVEGLWTAVDTFDEELFDRSLAGILWDRPLEEAVTGVVLPFLEELGHRWETGELSVGHEHFASNLVRHRLGALTLDMEYDETSPVAVLACPTGERHDLALLCFALLLSRRGWRTRFLGGDTPMAALSMAARAGRVDAVVVASTRVLPLEAHATSLRRLAVDHPVFIAGRGATPAVAELLGARLLPPDPVLAAAELAGDGAPANPAAG